MSRGCDEMAIWAVARAHVVIKTFGVVKAH